MCLGANARHVRTYDHDGSAHGVLHDALHARAEIAAALRLSAVSPRGQIGLLAPRSGATASRGLPTVHRDPTRCSQRRCGGGG